MEKRQPTYNFETSALGYGCMGLSHTYGATLPEDEGIQVLHAAVDAGYTLFDTAEIYGTATDLHHNETLVGKALSPVRDKVQLVSKFGVRFDFSSDLRPFPVYTCATPDAIRTSIEGSLRRLQTDYLDLYLQHRMDPKVEPEDVASVMADLIAEGKIRHWGISETNEEYLRRAHAVCPVSMVEMRYSMMSRGVEALFPVFEELGVGMLAFSPMANGVLTGAYRGKTDFDATVDYRATMPQFSAEADAKNARLFALLEEVAIRHDATYAQVSLAWMLCKKPWIVPIPGSRSPKRLAENAAAAHVKLASEEVAAIDNALASMEMSEVFGGSKVHKD